MNKPRILITIVLLIVLAISGYAQVNEDELSPLPTVEFINYEGPHARVDTREEIRQIGVILGQQISDMGRGTALNAINLEERRTYSYIYNTGAINRYYFIHSVSEPEDGKLDADIFGLGVDVAVDHIRNLRVIIQGYLQSAYDYSASDALLLAEFITIYNAVYRGNWNYFQNRYKTPVMDHLTRERVGLSIRYDEWPGRTLIVIPLGRGGGLSSIDTAVLSDERVIEELRKEEDEGIPQRQAMIDLMEREAEQAEQQAQIIREQIRQEETQIAQERTEIQQERQQIQQERQAVQEQQQQGVITQEEARQTQQELDSREDAVEQREQAAEQREEEVEEQREIAVVLEELAEERAESAQEMRTEVAQDQQAAIENQPLIRVVQETIAGVYGITIERTDPTAMGRIVRLNPATGAELLRSSLDTVHVRTVTFISGRIIAIAGETRGSGAVRLVEIDQNSLEMTRQGNDNLRAGSLLWVAGNDLYAIIAEGSNYYLGRFNVNFALQARSTIAIHPDAGVTIQQGRLLTQRANGSPLSLNPADLTELLN
ncbi:MAG: hypothetical protein FWC06_02990 [Treponema sp.]|nr:hypothetical protein [Treponema sp.]